MRNPWKKKAERKKINTQVGLKGRKWNVNWQPRVSSRPLLAWLGLAWTEARGWATVLFFQCDFCSRWDERRLFFLPALCPLCKWISPDIRLWTYKAMQGKAAVQNGKECGQCDTELVSPIRTICLIKPSPHVTVGVNVLIRRWSASEQAFWS